MYVFFYSQELSKNEDTSETVNEKMAAAEKKIQILQKSLGLKNRDAIGAQDFCGQTRAHLINFQKQQKFQEVTGRILTLLNKYSSKFNIIGNDEAIVSETLQPAVSEDGVSLVEDSEPLLTPTEQLDADNKIDLPCIPPTNNNGVVGNLLCNNLKRRADEDTSYLATDDTNLIVKGHLPPVTSVLDNIKRTKCIIKKTE